MIYSAHIHLEPATALHGRGRFYNSASGGIRPFHLIPFPGVIYMCARACSTHAGFFFG